MAALRDELEREAAARRAEAARLRALADEEERQRAARELAERGLSLPSAPAFTSVSSLLLPPPLRSFDVPMRFLLLVFSCMTVPLHAPRCCEGNVGAEKRPH